MSDPTATAPPEHLDVVIVGAGLSGIDMAYRLQTECPLRRYAILEARDAIGGTWDLFRYPGVRSDSDMATLAFPFRPWRGDDAIVDGPRIRDYLRETAQDFGIDRHIRFRRRVVRASWSSAAARWRLEIETAGARTTLTCGFLYMAAGYYDYDRAHVPDFAHVADFAGRFVVPQFWPDDLDVAGRRVVVIGSGATAMTLVPALAARAAHVTMVQRSPGYVVAGPTRDRVALALRRRLPARLADRLVRLKNVVLGSYFYGLARRRPERVRRLLIDGVRQQLGPGRAIEDFTPAYAPWDQRVCFVPDGDLFAALRDGRAEIVTAPIERFVADGVLLGGGRHVAADVVVAATGLVVRLLGGAAIDVDGVALDPARRLLYRGTMVGSVPNFALAFGYINASWTLKCDLSARYVCRVLNHMAARGYAVCEPRGGAADEGMAPIIPFSSGYVRRAAATLPRQGEGPWRVRQSYLRDKAGLRLARIEDGVLGFRRHRATDPAAEKATLAI